MNSFNIVHIADIHATDEVDAAQREQDPWVDRVKACRRQYQALHLVAATGDLGNRGDAKSLKLGVAFLGRLLGAAGNPPLVMTPGNHDVYWPRLDEMARSRQEKQRYRSYAEALAALRKRPIAVHLPRIARWRVPWFYWTPAGTGRQWPNVFVLPLSTVDLSGSSNFSKRDIATAADAIRRDGKLDEGLLTRALRADIPFVAQTQILRFERAWRGWSYRRKNRYQRAVKIAVVHHPLLTSPYEAELRPFDGVVNGSRVLSYLSQKGFHVVLYGHKHVMGMCIDYGVHTLRGSGPYADESLEMCGVAGGHLFSATDETHQGFTVLGIRPSERVADGRAIVVSRWKADPAEEPEERLLMTIAKDGDARWLHAGETGVERWNLPRRSSVVRSACQSVAALEDSYRTKLSVDEVDDLVRQGVGAAVDYAHGERFVDRPFVRRMLKTALSARRIVFVDHSGGATWLQPNLVEHLGQLLWVFAVRNSTLLSRRGGRGATRTRWGRGKWRHGPDIQVARIGAFGAPSRVREAPELNFDMARILLWKKEALDSPAARLLVKLHTAFDVPLFWVDPKLFDRAAKANHWRGVEPDFHAVWRSGSDTPEFEALYPDGRLVVKEDRDLFQSILTFLLERCQPVPEVAGVWTKVQRGAEPASSSGRS